ncbi:hypothetical protein BJV77DRAFT_1035521 [Russula vinacea]|nr:hypothetical protein BJV77DRAFT_1035521 [Russula vinacea]
MTTFRALEKGILSKEQLSAFQSSNTYAKLTSYIEVLNSAVVGCKLTDECTQSQGVEALIEVLDRVEALAKETPPVDNEASRFGNPAFKTFYDKVQQAAPQFHEVVLRVRPVDAITEVSGYFCESGMELNFLCWLICLEELGVVLESDHAALVIKVFWRYIQVMRTLQSTYWLEPAGSHGVWGLDDYHFLPFLFGSAQLRGHKYLRPKSIHDDEVVEEFSKDYMYLACIRFINSIKTASLRWHSPMLDDISAVKTWDKVNQGMIRMYHAEVLGKLPGPIVPRPADDQEAEAHAGWHDPAAEAQKKQAGARLGGPGTRPVPFD